MKQKIKIKVIVSNSFDEEIRSGFALIDSDFEKHFKPKGHYPARLYYAGELLNTRQLTELDLLDSHLVRIEVSP